jgi:hypothetical protein
VFGSVPAVWMRETTVATDWFHTLPSTCSRCSAAFWISARFGVSGFSAAIAAASLVLSTRGMICPPGSGTWSTEPARIAPAPAFTFCFVCSARTKLP